MRQPCMVPVVWLGWLMVEVKVLPCCVLCFVIMVRVSICAWIWQLLLHIRRQGADWQLHCYLSNSVHRLYWIVTTDDTCALGDSGVSGVRLHDSYCIRNIVQTCPTWYPLMPNDYSGKETRNWYKIILRCIILGFYNKNVSVVSFFFNSAMLFI